MGLRTCGLPSVAEQDMTELLLSGLRLVSSEYLTHSSNLKTHEEALWLTLLYR